MKLFRILVWACSLGVVPELSAASKTTARLVLSAEAARPGDTILAGVELRMEPKWHTYWRNGGDSGTPTTIDWLLPKGVSAGDVQWPVPEKLTAAELTTYIYHDTVMLLVPLKVADNLAQGSVELKAKVSWLECEEVCLPGAGEVTARLTIGSETKSSTDAASIQEAQKRLPLHEPSFKAQARWEKDATDDSRPLIIEWESSTRGTMADFYPLGGSDDFEVAGATESLPRPGKTLAVRKVVKKFGGPWPEEIGGLILAKSASDGTLEAHEVKLHLTDAAGKNTAGPANPAAATENGTPPKSLWVMLGLAFLGGLVLNIMPCVLPVIALKIFGFVNQGRDNPRRVRQLGMIYTLGVLVSFLVLAGGVIAVQQAGRTASWGMQFQNPQFLLGMTVLVTLVALNLFGLFEINLTGGAMSAAGDLAAQEGEAGAFFNGVLATALATPCTAPYLGVALGYAFSQPPAIIVLMFLTIGLGLATPYLILSWRPGWLKFLPKPGLWMEKFKIAIGFPMLATAVWLLSQTASHFGKRGPLWVGVFLVALALAAWIWGEFVQRGRKRTVTAMAFSLAIVAGAYFFILERELSWRTPAVLARSGEIEPVRAGGIPWRPWSAKAVAEARASGQPVLVDFTADWCLTCQVNKKTSLEIPSVQAKLKELDAAVFLGDYTTEDPAIASELKRFGRAGVPLVLVYASDLNTPTTVLPEVLTPGIVLEALNKVAQPRIVANEKTNPTP